MISLRDLLTIEGLLNSLGQVTLSLLFLGTASVLDESSWLQWGLHSLWSSVNLKGLVLATVTTNLVWMSHPIVQENQLRVI